MILIEFLKKQSVTLLLVSTSLVLYAHQISYAEYRIKDAIHDSRLNNKDLKQLEQELDISKLAKAKAAVGLFPVVDFHSQARNIDKTNGEKNVKQRGTSFNITQELFSGGRTLAQLKAANSSVVEAEAKYKNDVSKALLSVIESYHNVILYRKIYKMKSEQQQNFKDKLNQAKIRFKAGEASRTDVSAAKYHLAQATAEKEQCFGEVQNAEANFFKKIGKQASLDLVEVDPIKIKEHQTLESLLSAVRSNSFSIQRAKAELSTTNSGVLVAHSKLMPTVTGEIALSHSTQKHTPDTSKNKENTYSLNVRVPLFNSSTYIDIKEAKYKKRYAETSLENTSQELDRIAIESWNKANSISAQIESINEAVTAAQDALTAAQQEYKAGTKTLVTVLEFQERLFNAQAEQAKIKHQLILSYFNLKMLTGSLYTLDFEGF